MKVVTTILEKVLKEEAWCPKCNRFIDQTEVKYSYGHGYCTKCGEDTRSSDLLDEHRRLLEEALNYCKGDK